MEIDAQALGAVARTRAQGLHFWGRVVGVSIVGTHEDTTVMQLGAENARDATALATVADLSLGFAVRARGAAGSRLATTSLSLQLTAPAQGAVACTSRVAWSNDDGRALSEAVLQDDTGTLVGLARAWFLVLPLPAGVTITPMPWEREPDGVPPLRADDLTPVEHAAALAATQARARSASGGLGFPEELLGLTWAEGPGDDDAILGAAELGPHLANRVGDAQGGALYGAAATAARRLAGPGQTVVDGAMQYLRPGRGDRLSVTARALRRGRRAEFVDAEVSVDGRVAATARFTLLA